MGKAYEIEISEWTFWNNTKSAIKFKEMKLELLWCTYIARNERRVKRLGELARKWWLWKRFCGEIKLVKPFWRSLNIFIKIKNKFNTSQILTFIHIGTDFST